MNSPPSTPGSTPPSNAPLAWIGLVGPTASGKSGIGLMLAHKLPVEIVSVDSALVYRGMDIGTAKPTLRQRDQVAHHLIDVLEPSQRYSAAQFVSDAQACIRAIHARGRLPLLVGGTMLYFKALIDGLNAMPATDEAVRADVHAEATKRGWPALHAELAEVDPVTAARLHPTDAQRIQRALEVWRQTGRALSSFHAEQGPQRWSPRALISLEPHDRSWLHARIAERFAYMMDDGFLDEVHALRSRGDLHADLPSMRCVGYRQAWEAMDRGLSGAALAQRVSETGIAATRQLAKRQLTWLRSMEHRQVVDAQSATAGAQVLALCQSAWEV